MTSASIIFRYCSGSDWSRPNSALIAAIVSGVGFLPAIWRAGSIPGVAKKIRKTRTLSAIITRSAEPKRRSVNAITPPASGAAGGRAAARAGRARRARRRRSR